MDIPFGSNLNSAEIDGTIPGKATTEEPRVESDSITSTKAGATMVTSLIDLTARSHLRRLSCMGRWYSKRSPCSDNYSGLFGRIPIFLVGTFSRPTQDEAREVVHLLIYNSELRDGQDRLGS